MTYKAYEDGDWGCHGSVMEGGGGPGRGNSWSKGRINWVYFRTRQKAGMSGAECIWGKWQAGSSRDAWDMRGQGEESAC